MSQPKQLSSEHLPSDVVFDILPRLPVKSLVRFRCVSKSWNSIITSPDFITTHMNRPKSLSNNKGYLLYVPTSENHYTHYDQNLCIDVYNSDRTLTHISRFQLPFSAYMVGFCNGMCFLRNFHNNVLFLWNPSIRKFKRLSTPHFTHPVGPDNLDLTMELAYHSQNNDFKILGILCFRGSEAPPAEAVVYTLSTDSWKRVVISLGSINGIGRPLNIFFNGALHFIAWSGRRPFILSFDVNDERFRKIMLPRIYDHVILYSLAVFKGSLALFVCCHSDICNIWVMREYGVVESWTKISVPLDSVELFYGCTDSGEHLVDIKDRGLVSFDPVSRNENNLGIQNPAWGSYTADLMENLVLLNQNRVESQASAIRTLEAGGSSDPVPDAAGGITPPANEGNPMNTTVQSKEGSSCHLNRLAPELPSHPPVHGSTTLATLRSKSGHLHSGEQITLNDDDEEDKEDSKRGRLLVEEADYKSTKELFGKNGDEKTLDNFIPKSESDFLEYAELVSDKLRPYEKSFHYLALLKAVMRLSMTTLKAADAKDVASSVTAIANEKLKAEKEANAGKKKTGSKKKQLLVDKADDDLVVAYDALDDYDFM